jgi:hypothetical protein
MGLVRKVTIKEQRKGEKMKHQKTETFTLKKCFILG